MHRPVKEIVVEKDFISQLYEIFNEKMSKGDIQAEFYLSNSAMGDDYRIKLNLRQLFVLINALVQVPGIISVKEINAGEEDNPFTRSVFLLRDGTILKAARFYSDYGTPVLGINLGRLGFLSQATPDDLDSMVCKIIDGEYKVEHRMMLSGGGYSALNDFVVKGESLGRTSRFALQINGKLVCEYLADGIIISTPTGSTAYGMAAGGPVLSPEMEAIAIVPICPHTFSARPIVVNANDEIKIVPCPNNEYNVAVDGQVMFNLDGDLVITKPEKKANLALLTENDFYSVLRNKLHWSFSPAKR